MWYWAKNTLKRTTFWPLKGTTSILTHFRSPSLPRSAPKNKDLPTSEKKILIYFSRPPPRKSNVPSLRCLLHYSKMSFVPERNGFHTAFYMQDNLPCKNNYLWPFLSFSMLPSLLKRIHTDIRVVPLLYYTGTKMSVSFWHENPNKLI